MRDPHGYRWVGLAFLSPIICALLLGFHLASTVRAATRKATRRAS